MVKLVCTVKKALEDHQRALVGTRLQSIQPHKTTKDFYKFLFETGDFQDIHIRSIVNGDLTANLSGEKLIEVSREGQAGIRWRFENGVIFDFQWISHG